MIDNTNLRDIRTARTTAIASTASSAALSHGELLKIRLYLENRIYAYGRTGSGTLYYDRESEGTKLLHMHLVNIALSRGIKDFKQAEELVKHCQFKPILLEGKFLPHKPSIVEVDGLLYPNIWRKPDIQPDESIKCFPFVDHLEKMLGSKEKAQYLINYISLRYQQPDVKPHICFYFYQEKGGYGKSLFAETLEAIFGKSAVTSVGDQSAMNSLSSVDIWTRTWLIVQEMSIKAGSDVYNTIKTMSTSDSTMAARKGEHFKTHKTPAQIMMMSNHAPSFIEANDRRFFISEWSHEFDSDDAKNTYFNHYTRWLKHDGGYEAIAHLLATTDVSGIDIAAAAMMTPEKAKAIGIQADQATTEIKDRIEDNPNQRLFTESEFTDIFQRNSILANAIKHKLAAAGLVRAADCFKDKDSGGKNQNMYFWHRSEDNISRGKGRPAQIIHGNTKWESLVKDDAGYQKELGKTERGWG